MEAKDAPEQRNSVKMSFFASDWYLEKVYAGEFAVYLFGWIVTSLVLIRVARDRAGYLPLGYRYQNLKIIGLSLLWPLSLFGLPLGFVGWLVWMFLRTSDR